MKQAVTVKMFAIKYMDPLIEFLAHYPVELITRLPIPGSECVALATAGSGGAGALAEDPLPAALTVEAWCEGHDMTVWWVRSPRHRP